MMIERLGRGRGFPWILGIAAVALLVAFLASRGPGNVERRRIAYREAGIPVTEQELERSVPQMPETENEAYKLRRAMRDWKRLNPVYDLEFQAVDLLIRSNAAVIAKFQAEVLTNEASLELIHSITNPSRCRLSLKLTPESETGDLFYQFEKAVKESSGVLRLECRVHRMRGNPEGAAKALASGLRVARMLEQTRSLVGQGDHQQILDGWLRELEWLLSGGPLPSSSLDLLQRELELHDERLGLPFLLQDVRVNALNQFRRLWGERTGNGSDGIYRPGAVERVLMSFYAGSGIPSRDHLRTLDLLDRFSELAEKPTEDFQSNEPRVVHTAGVSQALSRMLSPGAFVLENELHAIWDRRLELVARIRCARTAVALERWRVRHDREIPSRLDLLVPEAMSAMLRQPSSAAPLLYLIHDSGYSIETPYGDSTHPPMTFSVQIPSAQPDSMPRP